MCDSLVGSVHTCERVEYTIRNEWNSIKSKVRSAIKADRFEGIPRIIWAEAENVITTGHLDTPWYHL